MTLRSIMTGLILGVALAAVGYLNDWGLKLPYMAGNLVPATVFGFLVVALLVLNPLLRAFRCRRLTGGEWCVVVALMLVACVVPGPSLGWQFADILVWPYRHQELRAGWQKYEVLKYAPPVMLADASEDPHAVVDGFIRGLGTPERPWPPVAAVPWRAFRGPLAFYLPLLALSFVATVCAVVVVHGQWARRERLRYPVADFTAELLAGAGRGGFPRIFRSRAFWIGFAVAAGVLALEGLQVYFPQTIAVPLRFDFSAAAQKWPVLNRVHRGNWMLRPRIFFVALGFAYFVSSDVSFSVGISHVVFAFAWIAALDAGVNMQTSPLGGGAWHFQMFGSYLGMMLVVLYVGRRFYGAVLRRAFWLAPAERAARAGGAVWAARFAILAAAAIAAILIAVVRLHWMLAILFVCLMAMMFIVLTRINVETGLIIIQPRWHAVSVLVGLFGFSAVGPTMFVILGLLAAVVAIDPRSCLMPMVANGLRVSEREGVRPARLGRWLALAAVAALVVGVFATIYVQYAMGESGHFFWGKSVGAMPFRWLERDLPGYTRGAGFRQDFSFAHIRPDRTFVYAAALGLAAVLVVSFLRLRFTWWPVHPVLFVVWGTCTVVPLTFSFLLGWLIKTCVTRFGGGESYRRLKPLFVGLVAGEFVAGLLWAAAQLAFRLTGYSNKLFRIHPF
jgi:hypothetical protein